MVMRSEEVVVSDPESKIEIGILKTVIAAGTSVRSLESAVETLDQLLERSEFSRDFIVISEADDLSDVEAEVLTVFQIELHCSERISAVAISYEPEVFRKLIPEVLKSLTHREDAWTNASAV